MSYMYTNYDVPKIAVIGVDGWHGLFWQECLVVGETPQAYRIKATKETRLAGRGQYLNEGDYALVPKHAIRLTSLEEWINRKSESQ